MMGVFMFASVSGLLFSSNAKLFQTSFGGNLCSVSSCFNINLKSQAGIPFHIRLTHLSFSIPIYLFALSCPLSSSAAVKIFALKSKNYRESLEDDHPSLDGARPKRAAAPEDGAQTVSAALDGLNARVGSAAEGLAGRLRRIGRRIQEEEEKEEEDVDTEDVTNGDEKDVTGSQGRTSKRPDVKVSAETLP